MFELGLYAFGAFFLYMLLLPLIGAIIGVLVYMGTPYLAGIAFASILHKTLHGSFFELGAFWIVAIVWTILLVHMRQIYKKVLELEHAWHEGHYMAAATVLLMGHPYRKAKKALVSCQ